MLNVLSNLLISSFNFSNSVELNFFKWYKIFKKIYNLVKTRAKTVSQHNKGQLHFRSINDAFLTNKLMLSHELLMNKI
jgi:hypothetical protein